MRGARGVLLDNCQIHGWLAKGQLRRRKMFYRLQGPYLSEHIDAGLQITKTRSAIKLELPGKRNLVLNIPEPSVLEAWYNALDAAANRKFSDFYSMKTMQTKTATGMVFHADKDRDGNGGAVSVKGSKGVLVKVVNKRQLGGNRVRALQREVRLALNMNDPNIQRTLDIFDVPNRLYIVLEYLENARPLMRECERLGPLPEEVVVHVMRGILSALANLHAMNVIHGELRLDNVVVVRPQGGGDWHVKLFDPGYGALLDLEPRYRAVRQQIPIALSWFYTAPEQLRGVETPATDIWMAGVCMYYMLFHLFPFRGEQLADVLESVKVDSPSFPVGPGRGASAQAVALLQSMLERDHRKRCSARDALCHPWITRRFEQMPTLDPFDLPQLSVCSENLAEGPTERMTTPAGENLAEGPTGLVTAPPSENLAEGATQRMTTPAEAGATAHSPASAQSPRRKSGRESVEAGATSQSPRRKSGRESAEAGATAQSFARKSGRESEAEAVGSARDVIHSSEVDAEGSLRGSARGSEAGGSWHIRIADAPDLHKMNAQSMPPVQAAPAVQAIQPMPTVDEEKEFVAVDAGPSAVVEAAAAGNNFTFDDGADQFEPSTEVAGRAPEEDVATPRIIKWNELPKDANGELVMPEALPTVEYYADAVQREHLAYKAKHESPLGQYKSPNRSPDTPKRNSEPIRAKWGTLMSPSPQRSGPQGRVPSNDISLGESEADGHQRPSTRRSSGHGDPRVGDPLTHVLLRRSLNIRESDGRQSEGPPVELDAYENRWLR